MAIQFKKSFSSTGEVKNCYAKICMVIYNENKTKEIIIKYFFSKDIRDGNGQELNRENIKAGEEVGDTREDMYNYLKTLPEFTGAINI